MPFLTSSAQNLVNGQREVIPRRFRRIPVILPGGRGPYPIVRQAKS